MSVTENIYFPWRAYKDVRCGKSIYRSGQLIMSVTVNLKGHIYISDACRVSESSLCAPPRRQLPLRPPLPTSCLSTHNSDRRSLCSSLCGMATCGPTPPSPAPWAARPLLLCLLGWRRRSTTAQWRGWSLDPRRGRHQDADPPLCRHEVHRCCSSSSRLPLCFTHLTVLSSLFPDLVKDPP